MGGWVGEWVGASPPCLCFQKARHDILAPSLHDRRRLGFWASPAPLARPLPDVCAQTMPVQQERDKEQAFFCLKTTGQDPQPKLGAEGRAGSGCSEASSSLAAS